jgi:hypothetical protein
MYTRQHVHAAELTTHILPQQLFTSFQELAQAKQERKAQLAEGKEERAAARALEARARKMAAAAAAAQAAQRFGKLRSWFAVKSHLELVLPADRHLTWLNETFAFPAILPATAFTASPAVQRAFCSAGYGHQAVAGVYAACLLVAVAWSCLLLPAPCNATTNQQLQPTPNPTSNAFSFQS